jgi:hypothetical protein
MKKPPAGAMAVLSRLGDPNASIVGDILEDYQAGRSRVWLWWQVASAIVFVTLRGIRRQPLHALAAVVMGWTVLLLGFTFGDASADGLAKLLWNWDRQTGYGTHIWWPFQICATLVSYAGFAMSAWIVGRVYRTSPAMLLAFVASVVAVLAASALVLEILMRRGPVPVPHPLFYLVSVTLPYQWRTGFLFVPFLMLLSGSAGKRAVIRSAYRA